MSALQRRDFLRGPAIAGCATKRKRLDMWKILLKLLPRWPRMSPRGWPICGFFPGDLPEKVRREASSTLLNWMGCAIGGSRQDAVTNTIAALASSRLRAGKPNRWSERMDSSHAALINGISSHVLDFDDTI